MEPWLPAKEKVSDATKSNSSGLDRPEGRSEDGGLRGHPAQTFSRVSMSSSDQQIGAMRVCSLSVLNNSSGLINA